MKSFKEIAEEYQKDINEGVKFKKKKTWVPDEKGKLQKVIKKLCVDADGQKVPGYKVDGKKCKKMKSSEIINKQKGARKGSKTKAKHQSKINNRADKIFKQRIKKGLVQDPNEEK